MKNLFIIFILCVLLISINSQDCQSGQYKDSVTGNCLACDIGAATCTSLTSFQSCQTGWYSTKLDNNSTDVSCTRCNSISGNQGVATCQNGVIALTCTTGYQLFQDKCIPCATSINNTCQSTCTSSGFYTNGNDCLSCLNTLAACNTVCLTQGYFTQVLGNNLSCLKCPIGASSCQSPNLSTSCLAPYYLAPGGKCLISPNGGQTVIVQSIPTNCSSGYYLSTDNTCVACAASTKTACDSACTSSGFYTDNTTCKECTISQSPCNSACTTQGFTSIYSEPIISSSCFACPDKASTCSSIISITKCISGYYLAPSGMCSSCFTQQSRQLTCTAQPQATVCQSGYFLNQTNCVSCASTNQICTYGCLKAGFFKTNTATTQSCTACGIGASSCINATHSTACFTGYYLQRFTCLSVNQGYISFANPYSTECLAGYGIYNGDCYLCGIGVSECTIIYYGKSITAAACFPGYYLYLQTCIACPTGASTCNAPVATSCLPGFFLQVGTCIACEGFGFYSCFNTGFNSAIGCFPGYLYSKENKKCFQCNNIYAYSCDSKGQDTLCQPGYLVLAPFTAPCVNTPISVVPGQPIIGQCIGGYYLYQDKTANTVQCRSCGEYATSCTSSGQILTCEEKYELQDGMCYHCSALTVNSCSKNKYVQTSVTCMTGYYKQNHKTCKACGITPANYISCIGVFNTVISVVCAPGKRQSAVNACENSCNGTGVATCISKTSDWSQDKILSCQTGYVLKSDSSACIACGTTVTNYVSCTLAANQSTIATVVCAAGYRQSAVNACEQSCSGIGVSTCNSNISNWTQNVILSCQTGYILKSDNSACIVCGTTVANYDSCTLAADQSTIDTVVCKPGFRQSAINKCESICNGTGVATCISKTTDWSFDKILSCKAGYALKSDGFACVPCGTTPQNYNSCTIDNNSVVTSVVCANGYNLIDSTNCQPCGQNMLSCTTDLISSCMSGLEINSQGGCFMCNGKGYKTCPSQNLPIACYPGFMFYQNQCDQCRGDDNSCSPNSIATSCSTGYILLDGICFPCPTGASACQGPISLTCNSGYYLSAGACVECGSNVATCTSNTVALTCNSGYYLSSSGSCVTCVDKAISCTVQGSKITGAVCASGYYFSGKYCIACSQTGANVCTASTTISCQTGYILTAENKCITCPAGANTCSSSTIAITCASGYYFSSGICLPCGINTETCTSYYNSLTCIPGYFLLTSAFLQFKPGTCLHCPFGSLTCTNSNTATSCQSGFFLMNATCIQCQANTHTCSSALYATACNTGYYLSNGACISCPTGSLCTASATITSCQTGYYLSNNACVTCPTRATACTSATVATACLTGFSLFESSTVCQSCPTGATTCSSSTVATACQDGYSLISGTCVQCPINAATCSSTTVALTCKAGYVVTQSGNCFPCLHGARTCLPPQIICSTGYVIVNDVCTQCASTTTVCASGCTSIGFFSGTNACIACATGATACTNATVATACESRYYLSNGVCYACPAGAAYCTSSSIINSCSVGYFMTTVNSVVSCTQCSVGANVCQSTTRALSCLTGYYKNPNQTCSQCSAPNSQACQIQPYALSCVIGYFPLNGVCFPCASTTQGCQPSCLSLGFFSNTVANVSSCIACSTGAASCTSPQIATSCLPGYYLNQQGSCSPCASNTLNCSMQVILTSCVEGYSFINGTCVKCPNNYATCLSAVNGTTCLSGFYESVKNLNCTACPFPAKLCFSATKFLACIDGYYPTPINGNLVQCTACPTTNNVVTCFNQTYALSCQQGFFQQNGTCIACPENSVSCPYGVISACNEGFFISNNTCQPCGTGVNTCSSNTFALTCKPSYALTSNKNCIPCGQRIASCTLQGNNIIATSCLTGFTLQSNTCACSQGTVLNPTQTSCIQCSSNCVNCTSASNCVSCASSFLLVNGECLFSFQPWLNISNQSSTPSNTNNTIVINVITGSNTTTNTNTTNNINANTNTNSNTNTNTNTNTNSNTNTNTNTNNNTNTNTNTNITNDTNLSSKIIQQTPSFGNCSSNCLNCTSNASCLQCATGYSVNSSGSCQSNFSRKLALINLNIIYVLILTIVFINNKY